MKDPIRNLLVYADGRVEEVPFRLAGMTYIQDERRDDGSSFRRAFASGYAHDGASLDAGNFVMVYTERGEVRYEEGTGPEKVVQVNGIPSPVEVTPRTRGWNARDVHKQCLARGGHQPDRATDACTLCQLPGYTLRTMTYVDSKEESERKASAALRDQLVTMSDENKALLVENAQLRRKLERNR